MEDKYTFKQALVMAIVGLIPALIAALQANNAANEAEQSKIEADKINSNAIIRQARSDERDLILADAAKSKESTFLIPLEDDNAWRLYLKCRDDGNSRAYCSTKNKESILGGLTSTTVGLPLK